MKNKGFTLVELLAIIAVLVTILLVSFPKIISVNKRDKEKQYNDMISTICKAGETYIYENENLFPNIGTEGNVEYIDIDDLMDDNLIDKSTINPKTGNALYGNIKYITEKDNFLKCYYDETLAIINMLIEETEKNSSDIKFLNTTIKSSNISKFEIHNDGINIPEGYESKDCSYKQDQSVMCYWKEDFEEDNIKYYEMNITANGIIYTPYDSSYLFYELGLNNLENLDFTGISTKFTYNMKSMLFSVGMESMINLNLGHNFDTRNVVDMQSMFNRTGAVSMTSLDLGNKFDTSNVTNMKSMFLFTGFDSMVSLDLGDKFDTSNVTDMSHMFENTGSDSMTDLDLGDKFDTSNVTNMESMFYFMGQKKLTSLDLGDKFDTRNVTNMQSMFGGTGQKKMTNLNLGNKFIISNNVSTKHIFYNCGKSTGLTIKVGNLQTKNKILNLDDTGMGPTTNIIVE